MSVPSIPNKLFLELPLDVYRASKEHLQTILTKYKIRYNESDTVATLRPIVADLKAYLRHPLTEERKHILRKLLSRTYLTDIELTKYPSLERIQEFLKERENLYDNPSSDQESNYEEIIFRGASPINSQPDSEVGENDNILENHSPQQLGVNFPPTPSQTGTHNTGNTLITVSSPQTRKMAQGIKEKLPLVSAGTYHGLATENPIDFIDHYEIAAQSNHWQEETKINLFPAHLTGTALAWYQYYTTSNQIKTWKDLKHTFINTFTPVAQAQTLQTILERKVQGRDQPVLTYYLEIITLCKRHDPEMSDKKIGQYVIQGLKPEFCDKILAEPCETLEQLEKSLRKIELQLQIKEANREKHDRASRENTVNHTEEINNLQAQIQNLTQVISNLTTGTRNSEPPLQHTPQQRLYNPTYPTSQQQTTTHYVPSNARRPPQQHYTPRRPTSTEAGHQGQTRQRHAGTSTAPRLPGLPRMSHPNSQYYYPSTTRNNNGTQCSICKRQNHKTQDCWYRAAQPRTALQRKYCNTCRMTNHSNEECYRGRKTFSNQKNG
jgi:hypothetical protein